MTEVIPVDRQVINDQLLAVQDDKSKVAVLLDTDDLQKVITAMETRWVRCSLLKDLRRLQKAAFGSPDTQGEKSCDIG